ncbi:TIGR01777 family oxidoreductase [Brevibacillus reuszeri]|uniref:TIGR01777 family oxidoreductase n=1 Tax=Brevibacillus reuszeri TaxID=54915 RepID=UPI00289A3AEB|nr:TIGR01777 family oxidoreductase [Brevibacillus reuszeri]
MNQTIVLAGGSGFLGKALATFLQEKGYKIVILTRGASHVRDQIRYVQWDGASHGAWTKEIEGCRAVVNFTGKSVNCLYTKKNREEIIRSRLDSVQILTDVIADREHPPPVFIQAGSLAIFGDTREKCTEESPHGSGFSVEVCQQWEKAFFARELPQTRKVLLRIGFALGKNGGALEPLVHLARYRLGGTVGAGTQFISWLHIDDLNQMFLAAIEDERLSGIFNATGPTPVTNKEFMSTLRSVMNKGWAPPTPTPFVWIGAYLIMRTDPSLALSGRNCLPQKLLDHGFAFAHSDLKTALYDLVQD